MFSARSFHNLARFLPRRCHRATRAALAAVALALGPPTASAAQLTLTWVDTSGGQAAFTIERKAAPSETFTEIAQQPAGVSGYVDATVAGGTTYCYRVRAFNDGGTSGYSDEACASPAGSLDLTVATAGTGTGTVTSQPAGITCGPDCFESYPGGSVVTLTATAAPGSTFATWGEACSGAPSCTLTGNAPVRVTATFAGTTSPTWKLTVRRYGQGTVTSSPSGINCTPTCAASLARGVVVTLVAEPAPGKKFLGWGGASCRTHGTGPCTMTLGKNMSVGAIFSK